MQKIFKFSLIAMAMLTSIQASALENVGNDYRIRTIIYGQNDVFRVNSIYGYQTVVEFQADEKIQTISVGNPSIFKIIPSQNRLFIKAYQNGQQTNMTLITNKRMYQFELTSNADIVEDLMYLVRFVYPGEMQDDSVQASGPMNIYSPISLPGGSSSRIDMPSIPTTQGLLGDVPDAKNPADDVPLSIQFRSQGDRKGLNQSPVKIETPTINSPFSYNKINVKFFNI